MDIEEALDRITCWSCWQRFFWGRRYRLIFWLSGVAQDLRAHEADRLLSMLDTPVGVPHVDKHARRVPEHDVGRSIRI